MTINGFTLLELLVVLAIAGVVAAFAIPSYRHSIITARINKASGSFSSALLLARSEAVKRGTQVNIIPVTNAGTTVWTNGWRVELNNTAKTLIQLYEPLNKDISVTKVKPISFLSTGIRNDLAANGPTVTIRFCDNVSGIGRQITLNVSGSPVFTTINSGCSP